MKLRARNVAEKKGVPISTNFVRGGQPNAVKLLSHIVPLRLCPKDKGASRVRLSDAFSIFNLAARGQYCVSVDGVFVFSRSFEGIRVTGHLASVHTYCGLRRK